MSILLPFLEDINTNKGLRCIEKCEPYVYKVKVKVKLYFRVLTSYEQLPLSQMFMVFPTS